MDDVAIGIRWWRLARDAVRIGLLRVPVLEQLADALVVLHEARVDTVGEPTDLELQIGALERASARRGEREVQPRHRARDLGPREDRGHGTRIEALARVLAEQRDAR